MTEDEIGWRIAGALADILLLCLVFFLAFVFTVVSIGLFGSPVGAFVGGGFTIVLVCAAVARRLRMK